MTRRLPLEGVRILEVGAALAVPLATRFLADMGAEVIKVESLQRPEVGRGMIQPDGEPGELSWETGGFYHEANRNKRGITLNLNDERGREILFRLVAVSDVVAENFAPRVMENWGITYEVLKEHNESVVYLSSSGYGADGPWRNYKAFGQTLAPTAGISHFTGHPDGPPLKSAISYTDTPAAMFNALAIMIALEHRAVTGQGQRIDSSQYEIGVSMLFEGLIEHQLYGTPDPRKGNTDPASAPHDVYPCKGEDQWIALAISTDAEWSALCEALGLGHPEGADSRLARILNRSRLDALIAEKTASFTKLDLQGRLQAAGLTAAAVNDPRDLLTDPHLAARGFFERVEHTPEVPELGERVYPGALWSSRMVPGPVIRTPAPMLGEDNDRVFRELLGIPDAEIEALEADSVIGRAPTLSRALDERHLTPAELRERGVLSDYDEDYQRILTEVGRRSAQGLDSAHPDPA